MIAVPDYSQFSISQVLPSLSAGLAVPRAYDLLDIGAAEQNLLLIVDGLGYHQLQDHADLAPFLAAATVRPIDSVAPTTTAAALTSIGTGVAPTEHGVMGLAFRLEDGQDLRPLSWQNDPLPEVVSTQPTWWQQAAAAGVNTVNITSGEFRDTGLSRLAYGGARLEVAAEGDETIRACQQVLGQPRTLAVTYYPLLDKQGHVYGVDSAEYRQQLQHVDGYAERLAAALPTGAQLVVTADHGMLDALTEVQVDGPDFLAGVQWLMGEPRLRYLYVDPDDVAGVAARWQDLLGDRAQVLTRAELEDVGLCGPSRGRYVDRLPDIAVVAKSDVKLTAPSVDRRTSGLLGQHGALTPAEVQVPLIIAQG